MGRIGRRTLATGLAVAMTMVVAACGDDDDDPGFGSVDTTIPEVPGQSGEPSAGPAVGDHWHAAFGFFLCGEYTPVLAENEVPSGVHTHGDGVIHIHPFAENGAGENATLGLFLEGAGITLTDEGYVIQGGTSYVEGGMCPSNEPAVLQVARWTDAESNPGPPELIDSGLAAIPLRDGEGYTVVFAPQGSEIPKPASAAQLTQLGAADGG